MLTKTQEVRQYYDLTMEIMNGCQHSCYGCGVDTQSTLYPDNEEFEAIKKMVDSFEDNGQVLFNFNLGPTDILSASNRENVLSDPRIKALAQRFKRHSITCAFLQNDRSEYRWLAEKIEALIPGGMIRCIIPFEVKHIDNEKYLATLKKHLEWFEEELSTVHFQKILVAINFDSTFQYQKGAGPGLNQEIIEKARKMDFFHNIEVDFTFPHGRRTFNDIINANRFNMSAKQINELLVDTMKKHTVNGKRSKEDLTVREFLSHEGMGWDTLYRNGKMYLRPFLVESFTTFDDTFEVKDDWSYEHFYTVREMRNIEQYEFAQTVDDCQGCQFVSLCAQRGVHSMMKLVGANECFSPIKKAEEEFMWT